VSQALERIIASRSIKDQIDRVLLFNLMALMAIKNPRHREVQQLLKDGRHRYEL
jgi:hypothetical protein